MLANARNDTVRASRCAAVVLLAVLTSCRTTTKPPPSANASQSQSMAAAAATTGAATRRLQVDPERTVVTVIVRRAGTRHNMLRAEVLDGEQFPTLTLRSSAASGAWPQPIVRVAVTLKGVAREQEIPVVVERDTAGLTARGELRLNQTDFGITPFSVAGGAIRVADTLEIRFELAAASSGALSQPPVP
jgi:YceI-like domain